MQVETSTFGLVELLLKNRAGCTGASRSEGGCRYVASAAGNAMVGFVLFALPMSLVLSVANRCRRLRRFHVA